jgi:transcriptional regulator with XRE-family HTH domain
MANAEATPIGPKLLFDGARLERERKDQGLTLGYLAGLVGFSRDAVRLWERGLNTPSANAAAALAHHLGLDINDLFRPVEPADLEGATAPVERVYVLRKSAPRRKRRLARMPT